MRGSRGPRSSASTRCREAIHSSPKRSGWRSFAEEATWRPANSHRSRTASRSSSRTASRDFLRGPSKPSRSSRPCRRRRWMRSLHRSLLPAVDDRLRPAIENGVVEVVGDRLRFTHPLLASAVYQKTPLARRRQLHARLATIVRDPEERARHLALSVEGPDDAVAGALEEAALLAGSRGAPQSAARALGDGPSSRLRRTEARNYGAGPTRRAWLTTSAETPRSPAASSSKR